MKARWS